VLRIAINRPPYNVLDIATMEEMNTALDMAMANRTAKVLVITGNGDKVFSSGVDVMDHTPDKVVKMIDVFHGLLKRLMLVPMPTVALVNGPALGGGCELAIACDMVVASEEGQVRPARDQARRLPADRRDPAAAPGADDQGDGTAARRRHHRRQGGAPHRHGEPPSSRVRRTSPPMRRLPRTIHLALARGPAAHQEGRQGSRQRRPFYEALHHVEHHYLQDLMATEDAVEGLNSFMEKRKPVWKNK
jgi:cyclohexa-1,5-dienecarbonyl-CoA hydratase